MRGLREKAHEFCWSDLWHFGACLNLILTLLARRKLHQLSSHLEKGRLAGMAESVLIDEYWMTWLKVAEQGRDLIFLQGILPSSVWLWASPPEDAPHHIEKTSRLWVLIRCL